MTSPSPPTPNPRPCAACRVLRRRCQPGCIFAPHFPADEPGNFALIREVYGASNVAKLLEDPPPELRALAARSLVAEAHIRVRYPVDGCMGIVRSFQQRLREVLAGIARAKIELSLYENLGIGGGVTLESSEQAVDSGFAGYGNSGDDARRPTPGTGVQVQGNVDHSSIVDNGTSPSESDPTMHQPLLFYWENGTIYN